MKIKAIYILALSLILGACVKNTPPEFSGSQLANPFIGVDDGGNTFPGACLPFSVMSISPDSKYGQATSGYKTGAPIIGFSHTHTSGTGGIGRYGNFLVYPQAGKPEPENAFSFVSNETALPGFYSASLDKENVDAEVVMLNPHTGLHQYTFKEGTEASILLDVSATRKTNESYSPNSRCTFVETKIIDRNKVKGCAGFKGGWGGNNPYKIYFVAEFDSDFKASGIWDNSGVFPGETEQMKELNTEQDSARYGAFFSFGVTKNKPVKMKIAIAYTGYEKAMEYFSEAKSWDMETSHQQSQTIWDDYLNRIIVKGGTADQRTLLYSGLYHSAVMPRDLTGDNPVWESDEPHYWDYYCIWDTYRTVNPLYMLIAPERQSAMIRCLLDIYQHKGWLPDSWIAGDYGMVQGGSNADVVISEAIQKKIPGFDYELAYEAMKKNSDIDSDNPRKYGRFLKDYNSIGYVPATDSVNKPNWPWCPVSRTEEYAHNDFCIAQVAKALGKDDDYRKYMNKSMNVFNVFNPNTKFFWGKDREGNWAANFDPAYRPWYWEGFYYEGSPWHYSTYVPHNMEHLIALHGGEKNFEAFLDTLFSRYYEASNQPDIHAPWLYHYVGRPDKTSNCLRKLMDEEFQNSRGGLPGNDDAGTMSVWYVFASTGLYPVPGQDIYLLSSPVFEETTIKVGNKNTLVIKAQNLSDQNKYIQSVTFRGKKLEQSWLRHSELMQGGELILEMGSKPSNWGQNSLPPSFADL
nr:GH92 family glycosyl hydrolase [uncultured Draconibacterium sp.]